MDTVSNVKILSNGEVLEILKNFVRQVIGEEYADEIGEINAASSFTTHLEMDSIEIVEFSEKVKSYFGEKVNFTSWLSSMEIEQIIALTLGDIANYIETCQG